MAKTKHKKGRINNIFKKQKFCFFFLLALCVVAIGLILWYLYSDNNKAIVSTTNTTSTYDKWVTKNSATYYYENGKYKVGWAKIDGEMYYFNGDGSLKTKMKIIDVSEHQGTVNWKKVKKEGILAAFIRCSYGWEDYPSQVDKQFETNYKNAKAAGIKLGVYHYSYATNEQEAIREAEYVNKALQGKEIDFEVVYDIENDDLHSGLSMEQHTSIITAFCEKIKSFGFQTMIYSDLSNITRKFNHTLPYDIWVAEYKRQCSFTRKYSMWQYTNKGLIDGIDDNLVDFNYRYFKAP